MRPLSKTPDAFSLRVTDALNAIYRRLNSLKAERAVTVAVFALIVTGPLFQLIAFRIDTGTFQWMQTAYDEPFYIREALTGPLGFGERTFSRLLVHLVQAVGPRSFDSVAIVFNFLLSFLAFGAAWILAGTLTKRAIERAAWALALVFGFQLLSLNSQLFFLPSLAQRLEAHLGLPWLFAADLFPYFNLYRTPEPQTTWVLFFMYLALLVRFADSLSLFFYRTACLITPLFVLCYITSAICAWLLFIILSLYSIVFLRLPIKLAFFIAVSATAAGLTIAFLSANGATASASVFDSRLPLLRASVPIALIGLAWLGLILQRMQWRLNARLVLAGACLSIPLIVLNQQIVTGKVIIAQQWELYCNYQSLVLGFGLLATNPGTRRILFEKTRLGVAAVALLVLAIITVVGHRSTYRAFLPTNMLSVAEAHAYRESTNRNGAFSGVVLTHFWDDFLFRIRVPDAASVIGGGNWLLDHPRSPVDLSENPEAHLNRNAAIINVGFELLARREFEPETLRSALQADLKTGECWPVASYFFAPRDCWDRLSNYRVRASQRLAPWIDPIVRAYTSYLHRRRNTDTDSPVLVLRRRPIEESKMTGLWHYRRLTEIRIATHGVNETIYAYVQTLSRESGN